MDVLVRRVERGDILYVQEIEEEAFGDEAYPLALMIYLYEYCGKYFLVAEVEKQIAGYIVACPEKGNGLHIYSIAVKKSFRRRGLGKKLLNHLIELAVEQGLKRVYLEVKAENTPAIRLYEKLGFRKTRRIKRYYSDGEDALVYVLDLS